MPASTLDDLLERYTQVSESNQTVLRHFTAIAHAFRRAEIACIVLKGADVISRLYGLHGTRPLSDVDLLVREADLPAIDRLLTSLGFAQQIDGNPSYRRSDWGLSLDLATTLWYLDERQLAEVWSRAVTRPSRSLTVCCLSTEDLLIHLTAYAVVHRGHLSSAFLQDLRLLIDKEAVDWPAILVRARQYGLRVPLFHGLHAVRIACPTVRIADDVLARLSPQNWREALVLRWFRSVVTKEPLPELGHVLLLLTQRPGTKLARLRRTLFPSAAFFSYRYGPAAAQRPWITGLRRLCRLALAALVLSGRLIRRLAAAPREPR
jgi:hypothetical protein